MAYDANDAWLYDAAFGWDISDEVAWLSQQLGGGPVLEPACGSGRMLIALARAGIPAAGFDRSEAMLDRARRRFRDEGREPPELLVGDVRAFFRELR